jgi:hypothetical protein
MVFGDTGLEAMLGRMEKQYLVTCMLHEDRSLLRVVPGSDPCVSSLSSTIHLVLGLDVTTSFGWESFRTFCPER